MGLRLRSNEASRRFSRKRSGGVAFGLGLRCHGRHSPLWGCSARSASPQTKIPSRGTPCNFQTGSKRFRCCARCKIPLPSAFSFVFPVYCDT